MRKVTITQQDIDRGRRQESNACPVWWALGEPTALVHCSHVSLDGDWWVVEPALARFIRDFDAGRPVAPGEYRLRLPGAPEADA